MKRPLARISQELLSAGRGARLRYPRVVIFVTPAVIALAIVGPSNRAATTIMSDQHRHLLTGFGRLAGIPDLAFDENGHCALAFDDDVLDFEYLEGRDCVMVYGKVGELPAAKDSGSVRALLDVNSASSLSGKGSFAVDPTSRTILYVDRIAIGQLTTEGFAAALGALLDDVLFWKANLPGVLQQEPTETPPAGTSFLVYNV